MNMMLMALSNETIGMIIDIAVIIIIVGYAVAGLAKGFIESLLKFLGTIGALAAAIFGARPVLNLVNGMVNISNLFANLVLNFLNGQSEVFSQTITDEATRQNIIDTIRGSELFSVLKDFMIGLVQDAEIGSNVGEVISGPIGYIISVVVVAIVIFLLVKLIVLILSKLFDSRDAERGGKSGMDRTLGLFLGTAKGIVFVLALLLTTSLLTYIPFISNNVTPCINETHVVKPTYNFVNEKVETFIQTQDWNEIINNIFKK